MFQGLPRTLIAFGAVLIVILELLVRLPDILLLPQRLQGQIGELGAKAMQPQVVTTQVAKTEADTRLADAQAQLNIVQQGKVAAETEVTKLQAMVTAMQVDKTQADTRLAQMQAALAASQATKTEAETRLAEAQTNKTNIEASQQRLGLALATGIVGLFAGTGQQAQQATQQTEQQPPSQEPAPAQGSPPLRQPAFAHPAKAPTGAAILTSERFIALANAADDAVARHDCTIAIQKYNEGEAIMRSIPMKKGDDLTADQRNQGMRIASLRIFINNPQNCPGQSVR